MREMTAEEARRHFPKLVRDDLVRQARGEVTMREILEGDNQLPRAEADRVMGEFKDFAERIGNPVTVRDGEIVFGYGAAEFIVVGDDE